MTTARRLVTDSCIKVILPASPVRGAGMRRQVNAGMKILASHFSVESSDLIDRAAENGMIPDEDRAAELNQAILSRDIDAVIAGRGGYGSLRLLPLIDFEACSKHPKLIIGYSDITILQLALFQKTGIPSLSGPMLLNLSRRSMDYLLPLLSNDSTGIDLIPAAAKKNITVMQSGKAEGVLLGGNLFSLVQMIGTGFLPRLDNAIFFFEDIDETVDHIDSFLSHLKSVGQLYKVSGVVIGDISLRHQKPLASKKSKTETLRRRITGMFRKDIPVIMGVNYGHLDDAITIPIGVRAELDSANMSLTLTENITHA
jgi:muramoyltetrapeptide carboxypeptidase